MIKNKKFFTSLCLAAFIATSNITYAAQRHVINEGATSNISNQEFRNLDSQDSFGGAVENKGTVGITDSQFYYNKGALGGAIANTGTIKAIKNCIFEGNENTFIPEEEIEYGGQFMPGRYGGAIFNVSDSVLTIESSKFINNKSNTDYGDYSGGGAIYSSGDLIVKNTLFQDNKAEGFGGAILINGYNTKESPINPSLIIDNSEFRNNIATVSGGAIDIEHANGDIMIQKSKFIANKASGYIDNGIAYTDGGAISVYTDGKLNISGSFFQGNSSTLGSGGAIYASGGNIKIENTDFKDNLTTGGGGAIYSSDNESLRIVDTSFIANKANTDGGALFVGADKDYFYDEDTYTNNNTYGTVNILGQEKDVIFSGNSSNNYGGAIYNNGAEVNIEKAIFTDNKTGNNIISYESEEEIADLARGGAIFNKGQLTIKNSAFTNNKALLTGKFQDESGQIDTDGWGAGGAIDHSAGTLKIENTIFENNLAGLSGGAINTADNTIIKNTKFINNTASSPYNYETSNEIGEMGAGGAISVGSFYGDFRSPDITLTIENSEFIGNTSAEDGGGAIALEYGNADIIDTQFTNNTTTGKGGALLIQGYQGDSRTVNITAKDKNVVFSDNKAALGNDIYLESSTLNLNTLNNNTISFDGGIVGKDSIININGDVILKNVVTSDKNSTLAVNLQGGKLDLSDESYLKGADLTLEDGAILSLMNNKIGLVEVNTLKSNNGSINIDMDLGSNSEQAFDFITANSASGTLNIENINVISDLPENLNVIPLALDMLGISDDLQVKTKGGVINSVTNDYLYAFVADGKNLLITRAVDADGNAKKIDGFTVAFNQSDSINGNLVDLSDNRTFSATKDIVITGETDRGWTGNLGGKALIVNGQGHTLQGSNHTGMIVENGQTLTFNDTNISGFQTSQDRKGALTVNDGGELNIVAINNNVTLGDVSGTDKNVIYLDGTTSKAFLQTNNSKEITLNNDVRSSAVSNNLMLRGDGKIIFNGIIDPVTITNENKDTVHNNYIYDVTYNINSGMVTFSKDAYLNGQGNKNILNMNGGTLNIANGAVGLVDLAALNLNSNSNLMLDADLAREVMDQIKADNVTGNSSLNVSGINLLSDSTKDVVSLNLTDNKSLAGHITNSVNEVAYSNIYKYGVSYDPLKGNFIFTRGGGSSDSSYNAYNPAVMVSPVAAQIGGYMGMLDTYNHSFNHMDMYMMKPSNLRLAEVRANQYAISEAGKSSYMSNELNSKGIWYKPFAAYDSVGLKNGPKVKNFSYGTFIGGDSEMFKMKNGFYGVISPYIAYQGSHQTFSGNSIYQNGGTLGVTSNFYKGNFFTGLTIGAGMNVSEASTMYGNENFPMLMAGIANKTGYNMEFKNGKFIIQPSMLLSYTFVNTFDYTNGAGVRINSDPLHALQIAPSVKFIYNTKNGWQPYAHFGMMWNIMDDTQVAVNTTSLPELSVKPYFQYGVGIQKLFKDNFTGYGQVMLRNGGRNGIAAFAGFRYMLGKKARPVEHNKTENYRNLDMI